MVQQVSDTMSDDRPISRVIWRLESEGWSFAEHLILRSDGHLTWIVSGRNGPNAIRSEGATMAEAWTEAAEQARSPTPGSARLAPLGLPWIISQGSGRDVESAAASDHCRPAELQFGDCWMTMDDRGEQDGATPHGDKPKPKHQGRRRADDKIHRGRDHARRANPRRY